MGGSLVLVAAIGSLVYAVNPGVLWVAGPFLILWLLSPQVAYWIGRPISHEPATLTEEQQQELRRLARRTWRYFEHFVGPEDRWLAPDHFQESPRGQVTHSTSPTNIGLMLLSTLAAYDLGYMGLQELAVRIRNTFETLDELEQYRGHFLNWYDTRSLAPLPPRYVSTVDSGNLAGSLIALRQGCLSMSQRTVLRWRRWQGLLDTLDIIDEVVTQVAPSTPHTVEPLQTYLAEIRRQILAGRDEGGIHQAALLAHLVERKPPGIGAAAVDPDRSRIRQPGRGGLAQPAPVVRGDQLPVGRHAARTANPGPVACAARPAACTLAAGAGGAGRRLAGSAGGAAGDPALGEISAICGEAHARLNALRAELAHAPGPIAQVEEARQWSSRLTAALDEAQTNALALQEAFESLAARAEKYTLDMDFGFLYSPQREVFHIGYNVDAEKADGSYYDLLASEARIASLIAIAKGDVPEKHWLHLGRPLTEVEGMRTLLSWSGTMFEYLMPILLTRSYANTLLDQSIYAVVAYQMDYARQKGVPWGISESGYYRFDQDQNYQYRAFGTPGLGFKRGLGDDLVVAPYASLLALPVRPQAVMDNLATLAKMGMLGDYGYYEAIDFTPGRLDLGQEYAIVREYMVHHQGMTLLSLANYLRGERMVNRFHADPRIQSAELLLQEQIPYHAPLEEESDEEGVPTLNIQPSVVASPWRVPVQSAFPQVNYLSNGRYGVLITNSGGGYSRWQDKDLTRWSADATQDNWGAWVYLQDDESGELWSLGAQPTVTAIGRARSEFLSAPGRLPRQPERDRRGDGDRRPARRRCGVPPHTRHQSE